MTEKQIQCYKDGVSDAQIGINIYGRKLEGKYLEAYELGWADFTAGKDLTDLEIVKRLKL